MVADEGSDNDGLRPITAYSRNSSTESEKLSHRPAVAQSGNNHDYATDHAPITMDFSIITIIPSATKCRSTVALNQW